MHLDSQQASYVEERSVVRRQLHSISKEVDRLNGLLITKNEELKAVSSQLKSSKILLISSATKLKHMTQEKTADTSTHVHKIETKERHHLLEKNILIEEHLQHTNELKRKHQMACHALQKDKDEALNSLTTTINDQMNVKLQQLQMAHSTALQESTAKHTQVRRLCELPPNPPPPRSSDGGACFNSVIYFSESLDSFVFVELPLFALGAASRA